jgi:hypothetical protein
MAYTFLNSHKYEHDKKLQVDERARVDGNFLPPAWIAFWDEASKTRKVAAVADSTCRHAVSRGS